MTNFMQEQKRQQSMASGGSDEAAATSGESRATTVATARDNSEADDANVFLVCVYEVSPDIPYTILRAPQLSTANDVIKRVR